MLSTLWTFVAFVCAAAPMWIDVDVPRVLVGAGVAFVTAIWVGAPRWQWLTFASAPVHLLLIGEVLTVSTPLFVMSAVLMLSTLASLVERPIARLALFSLYSLASAALVTGMRLLSTTAQKPVLRALLQWPMTLLLTLFVLAALDNAREQRLRRADAPLDPRALRRRSL